MGYSLHLVALPHTTLTEKDSSCAYSMKCLKAVPMWRAEGHRVILYGPDEIACEPDEHVIITTEADRLRWGYGGPKGYDTTKPFLWDASQPYWFESNTRTIDALKERLPQDKRGHFLCLIAGWTQQPVAHAVAGPNYNNPITIEWGVGYEGIFSEFCAFESYAWMHHVYGLQKIVNGRAFDSVIPNFFDASQFSAARKPSADYVLYLGRIIQRKGPHIAAEIAKRVGLPLKVAGPGALEVSDGRILGTDNVEIIGDVEHVGPVGFGKRNELMRNAAAVIVPTVYVEPFGGVAVEAMLAGAPVIASDWGSFTEIVTPEVGGRFRTPKQAVEVFKHCQTLDRKKIRKYALERYSLEAVGPHFTRWFDQLNTLWGKGWYE